MSQADGQDTRLNPAALSVENGIRKLATHPSIVVALPETRIPLWREGGVMAMLTSQFGQSPRQSRRVSIREKHHQRS